MGNLFHTVLMPHALSEAEKRQFVLSCDRAFEDRMERVAERITKDSFLHFLGLTGPTCSGKTTAAHKLTETLEAHGHRVHVISIDDFYYNKTELLERSRQNGHETLDYDSEETIDIALLREKTEDLLLGKETRLPRFDFHSGMRCDGVTLQPQKGDVFLFEGIQILYPGVHGILDRGAYQSIYIAPMSAIEVGGKLFEPNEIRLMRRLVRDSVYRSTGAEFTLYLWQSVRQNEEKNIFPNAHLCNEFLDSTCAYEIGMLKPYLQKLLKDCVGRDTREGRQAQEILRKIQTIDEISSDYITPNSLYKEFI